MKGDRVKIVANSNIHQEDTDQYIFVYGPIHDQNGNVQYSHDGSVLIESLGGVQVGSTGFVNGNAIKVHRANLKDAEHVPGLGGNDYVNVVPVYLEQYQRHGWFPSDNLRIQNYDG